MNEEIRKTKEWIRQLKDEVEASTDPDEIADLTENIQHWTNVLAQEKQAHLDEIEQYQRDARAEEWDRTTRPMMGEL